ncbi:MAG: hypothetical protein APZ16_04425 [Candidatus Hadarchaeum yellowstonense]|uniref:Uncharacterized protein n=1 Tax=Hadarchaeum yellowstonense TaxID=1776334 RepID=A0A147JVU6_HADYE|nr:MAG: hypothetical protein APZ16_04425 [Candidatus Hadarchaeum yellowstonense]
MKELREAWACYHRGPDADHRRFDANRCKRCRFYKKCLEWHNTEKWLEQKMIEEWFEWKGG